MSGRMNGLRWRLWALVLATLLVVPSGALAKAAQLCSMTGERTFSCCCAAAKSKARKSAKQLAGQPRVQADDCCESCERPETAGVLSTSAAGAFTAALLERVTVEDLVSAWRTVEPGRFAWSRGPPSTGPPLFIKHCSLLNCPASAEGFLPLGA